MATYKTYQLLNESFGTYSNTEDPPTDHIEVWDITNEMYDQILAGGNLFNIDGDLWIIDAGAYE